MPAGRPTSLLPLLCLLALGCGASAHAARGPTTPGSGGRVVEAQRLELGAEQRGTLATCDPRLEDGRYVHRYALELADGDRVRLAMHSSALDSVLELEGPGDFRLTNDDGFPGNLDSVVVFRAPAAGTYLVRATTVSAGQVGPYLLRTERFPEASAGTPLALGTPSQGALLPSRQGQIPGSWFRFEAQGGSWVRLRVTSTAFDTVATVIGPRGQIWLNDDANDLGPDRTERALDSTVLVGVPESGTYQLVVTAYADSGAGTFRVASTVRPPVVLAAGQAVPAGGFAGATAEGRLYGVFAGITAYDSRPLYGCADDATFLAEAFRARNLMSAAEQRVLTDRNATKQAFLEGIRWLAERASPSDVVIVFYSGHGNQQAAPEGDTLELDHLDETIQLIDGPLTDTEVAAAFEGVHAQVAILALDSCHSGGFEDDFVTRAGRVGLFSSDHDVLSDTAEPHRAGGYLSWHLRRGVLGEADRRPADGFLQVGELSDYLYAGFVRDHALMNRDSDLGPMQRLVVSRGSVGFTDTLWVYPRRPDLTLPPIPELPLESAPAGPQRAPGVPAVDVCTPPVR